MNRAFLRRIFDMMKIHIILRPNSILSGMVSSKIFITIFFLQKIYLKKSEMQNVFICKIQRTDGNVWI
jgi:hypothetical protein